MNPPFANVFSQPSSCSPFTSLLNKTHSVLLQLYFSRLNCSFINTFRLPTMLFDLFLVIFLIYFDLFILPRDLWSSKKSISSKLLLFTKIVFDPLFQPFMICIFSVLQIYQISSHVETNWSIAKRKMNSSQNVRAVTEFHGCACASMQY